MLSLDFFEKNNVIFPLKSQQGDFLRWCTPYEAYDWYLFHDSDPQVPIDGSYYGYPHTVYIDMYVCPEKLKTQLFTLNRLVR